MDFYLQQSWYDEAIDLAKPSRFDIFIVKEVWLRVILQALLPALESQAVFARRRTRLSDVLGRLQTIAVSDTPGVPDRLYAMFIKRVDPIEYVPVSRAKPTTGGITGQVVIWHSYDPKSPEATVLTATVARAAKANPEAKIQLEAVAANQMEDKLFTSIAAGDSPDLVLWRGSSLRNWVGRNVVLPLDNVIAREAAVASAGYDGLSFGGKLWGVPLNFQVVALYMNQKAANPAGAAGQGVAAPTSLDDWRALANKGVAPTVLVRDPYHCYGFFTAFSGKVLDDSGKCALMQGGFQQALEYLVEMQDEGHVQFMDATQASDQLAVGKCVITIGGPWVLEKLRKALGDGLVAFAIPPNTREGTIPAKPLLDVEGFFVASGSRNAANAAKLALQLADAQAQAEFADAGFKVPVRMDVKPKDAALTVFRQVAQGAEPWPQQARFEKWWTPFTTLLDDVLNQKVGIPVGLAQACQTIDAG